MFKQEPVPIAEKRRFRLFYRLNAECAWQPAYPEGVDVKDATEALLLSVKTIYRLPAKSIEITEFNGIDL